jgi:transcriptional regulator with XRE-family HTH domain
MGRVKLQSVLGSKIRRLRLDAEMTQAALAERCGLFRTHVSRIECGTANPTLTAIVAIARALDVEPAVLLIDNTPSRVDED